MNFLQLLIKKTFKQAKFKISYKFVFRLLQINFPKVGVLMVQKFSLKKKAYKLQGLDN